MKTLQYISDTPPHPQVSEFKLEFPTTHAQIISSFRDHLRSLPRQSNSPNNPQKIVAVIDSIASNPGVLLPWREMVNICREEGVWSVIDAAHSIGQELNIDVGASGCDFWITVSCASGYRVNLVDIHAMFAELSQVAPCATIMCDSLRAEEVSSCTHVPLSGANYFSGI
jgi:Cys-tRNA synthase (O-phospho-L-seryl-tRNA:Cys-tRNA synthase)